MILTRLWAVILAVLATACLAGMFMLSAGASGDFDDNDRESLRALTEAGVAALDAEIKMSTARLATPLARSERLVEAVERLDPPEGDDDEAEELPAEDSLPQIFAEVAEEHRVAHNANTTLALIDRAGTLVAVNGIAEPAMGELVMTDAYKAAPSAGTSLFSVILGGELYVANVMPPFDSGHRLVAVEPLNIGAGSVLRRVLGANQPAALVRKAKIIGGIIGDQPLGTELKELATEHLSETPATGASRIFSVGTGLDRRIGALGRLPGPAGEGPNGVLLAVLSRRTAAAGQQDLGEALRQARAKGVRLNWLLLGSLLLISVGLALYLPSLEAAGPIRRLASEFHAVATGTQHQIFHDRYGGAAGQLARTAAATIEALRQAFLAELEIDEDDVGEPIEANRSKRRTAQARRLTRAHEQLKGRGRDPTGRAEDVVLPKTALLDPATEPGPGTVTEPSPTEPPRAPAPTPAVAAPAPSPPRPPPPAPTGTPRPGPLPTRPGTLSPPIPAPPLAADGEEPSGTVPMPGRAVAGPGVPPGPPPPPRPPAPPPAVPPPLADAQANVLPGRGANREEYYREIFEEFVQVKIDCGEPTENLSFERFAAKLRKNARDLKASRPEISDVRFTVYIKDGKAALKAKVVR